LSGSFPPVVLLAERQGVVFVAAPHGLAGARLPRHLRRDTALVVLPATEDEVRAAELQPPDDPDAWPQAIPRPDLLAPALSRLLQGEHDEMTLSRGRDGVKGILVSADGQKHPFPVAPRDALGLMAALFRCAPRGVVPVPGARHTGRLLLSVRPGARPHEFRLRIDGLVGEPPRAFPDLGFSASLLEVVVEALDRPSGFLGVSGGSASGRSLTLDRMAETLLARGRRGGRIGPRGASSPLPWLSERLSDWPFPESLRDVAPDFVLMDALDKERDLLLAAGLAAGGALVLAGLPPGEPEARARRVRRIFEEGARPGLPVAILAQGLVRTVCRACRTTVTLPPEKALRLGFHRRDVEEIERRGGLAIPRGAGCDACARTGAEGLTGIFAWSGPDGLDRGLPSLQEEGWRRAADGVAVLQDVLVLPADGRGMRSLREVAALAGAPRGPRPDRIPDAVRDTLREGDGGTAVPATAVSTEEEALRLEGFWSEAAAGTNRAKEIEDLARTLSGRAADASLPPLLASGSHAGEAARHAVNTALIAARLSSALGSGEDAPAAALLALLNEADLPSPGMDRLGAGGPEMRGRIAEVRALLDPALPSTERSRADLRIQAVALAALAERLHQQGRERGLDLHDVTSLVMAQHGQRFSPLLFRALLRAVPIYPIGCLVELSSGDVARVVTQNEENHFRPRVEIASAGGGTERRVVDLARAPFLHIRHRVAATERA
jgi:hypothetical protein